MNIKSYINIILLIVPLLISLGAFAVDEPPVKKSNTGICHPKGALITQKQNTTHPTLRWKLALKVAGVHPKDNHVGWGKLAHPNMSDSLTAHC